MNLAPDALPDGGHALDEKARIRLLHLMVPAAAIFRSDFPLGRGRGLAPIAKEEAEAGR